MARSQEDSDEDEVDALETIVSQLENYTPEQVPQEITEMSRDSGGSRSGVAGHAADPQSSVANLDGRPPLQRSSGDGGASTSEGGGRYGARALLPLRSPPRSANTRPRAPGRVLRHLETTEAQGKKNAANNARITIRTEWTRSERSFRESPVSAGCALLDHLNPFAKGRFECEVDVHGLVLAPSG